MYSLFKLGAAQQGTSVEIKQTVIHKPLLFFSATPGLCLFLPSCYPWICVIQVKWCNTFVNLLWNWPHFLVFVWVSACLYPFLWLKEFLEMFVAPERFDNLRYFFTISPLISWDNDLTCFFDFDFFADSCSSFSRTVMYSSLRLRCGSCLGSSP